MTSNILQSVNAVNVFTNKSVLQVQSSKKLFDWLRGPVESAGREAGRRLGFFVTYLAEGTGELTTLFGEHATRLHKRSAHTGGSLLPNPIVRDRLTLLPKLGRRRWRQDLTFLPTLAALSLPSRVPRVSSSQPPPRRHFFLSPPSSSSSTSQKSSPRRGSAGKSPAGLRFLAVSAPSRWAEARPGLPGRCARSAQCLCNDGKSRRNRRLARGWRRQAAVAAAAVKAAATPPPPPLPALPLGLPQAGWWP